MVTDRFHEWGDDEWMTRRAATDPHSGPMSIYEVHIGSWRQGLGYRGLADELVPYVKEAGFTHVEFLPVAEHPFSLFFSTAQQAVKAEREARAAQAA